MGIGRVRAGFLGLGIILTLAAAALAVLVAGRDQPIRDASPILPLAAAYGALVAAWLVLRHRSSAWRRLQEAEWLHARRRLFTEVSNRLAIAGEVEGSLPSIARAAVPALGDGCAIQLVDDTGVPHWGGSAHVEPAKEPLIRAIAEAPLPDALEAQEVCVPQVVELDAPRLARLAAAGEVGQHWQALGTGALLLAPMMAGDRRVGTLVVFGAPRRFTADDIGDAGELAFRTALALDHERLRAGLAEARQRHRLLFEAHPQPMWIFDTETLAFLDVNDAAVQHYGYARDEFLRMTVTDLRPPDEPPAMPGAIERSLTRRPSVAFARHQRKDGALVDVEIISHELPLHGMAARLVQVTDVTERARTMAALQDSEEQLRQARRMEAVGRIAGALAHEFNNLLTSIRGFSDLLSASLHADDPRRSDLAEIRRAADRGAALTRQILAFAGRPAGEPRPVDLNSLVAEMESLIQRLGGAELRVATVLAPRIGLVLADPAQLEQVLLSLVLAARDAMPQGGELLIETFERHIEATRDRHVRPGHYVVLAVSDTGSDADREAGGRSGVGLSVAYRIVKQVGGIVRVLTRPGQGTTVRVYLPRHEIEEAPALEEEVPDAFRGGETILVVEDEEAVRELLRRVLTRYGYRVLEARHGADALREAARHEGPIHLLVTDVMMPEVGGRELVERLLPERPEIKVLYISGYTSDEIVRRGLADPGATLLQKPFVSDELVQRIRAVLDGPTGQASSR